MHFFAVNFIGRFLGHSFDVDAALSADYDYRRAAFSIQQYGKINLALDIDRFGYHDFSHQTTIWTGLIGHEVVAQHVLSNFTCLGWGRTKLYAAFEAILENAFSSTSRMNLRFHDELRGLDTSGNFFCLFRRLSRKTLRRGDSEPLEKLFGLIFVDIHEENKDDLTSPTRRLHRPGRQ